MRRRTQIDEGGTQKGVWQTRAFAESSGRDPSAPETLKTWRYGKKYDWTHSSKKNTVRTWFRQSEEQWNGIEGEDEPSQ